MQYFVIIIKNFQIHDERTAAVSLSWEEVEAFADENGFIGEKVYTNHCGNFPVCPPPDPEIAKLETDFWNAYLSKHKKSGKKNQLYQEMFRYEWYEGWGRSGFRGNIEKVIQSIEPGQSPVITILSAGCGRDLLKVGLAAGIWESTAGILIKGTYKEINMNHFRLAKPGARIMLTEFDKTNLKMLHETVNRLIEKGLLTKDMVAIRRWSFRERTPLVANTQDIVVFALTGNYTRENEQPLILREIVRCIKPGGHFVGSTISDKLDFHKARSPLGRIKVMLTTPLALPVAVDFTKWQLRFAKIAGIMNEKGYWANLPAEKWMEFIQPYNMRLVKIYPGPSSFLPVDVLLAQKFPDTLDSDKYI